MNPSAALMLGMLLVAIVRAEEDIWAHCAGSVIQVWKLYGIGKSPLHWNWSNRSDPEMFDTNTLQTEDTHEHVVVEHHLIPMRDGIRLATDVYRPAHGADMPDESSLKPALLHRTPYDKGKAGRC